MVESFYLRTVDFGSAYSVCLQHHQLETSVNVLIVNLL